MKKILLLLTAALLAAGASMAQTPSPDQVRIYLNAGHGSWGPNDRPMATIPYPNLPETGRPDTCGFYESNTNLWKILKMGETLVKMGVDPDNIMYSRVKNGPYPYVAGAADAELYNRPLSEIAREVDANNMDMFVSIHSNATTEGSTTNYPLFLYRGQDKSVGPDYEHNEGSYEMCDACWVPHYMDELDPQNYYSRTSKNIRGDWNFYGETYETTTVLGTFRGYLGVLRHGTPGFLMEGYFHTYQPARHRALNMDYCHQEGVRTARGVCDYFGLNPETTGYIMGTVKDLHEKIVHPLFNYAQGSIDEQYPINGAEVRLLKDGQVVKTYQVDNNYNGIFVFEDLEPGNYTLDASAEGYKDLFDDYKEPIEVTANATAYSRIFLERSDYEPPAITFENYPDPVQAPYLTMADEFNYEKSSKTFDGIEGDIKRMIVRGDTTLVLAHNAGVPAIYYIKTSTQEIVKQISTNGLTVETDNLGFYASLSDIALTADNRIVGINSVRTQQSDRMVETGYKRGTLRYYLWKSFNSDPQLWLTTQESPGAYRSDMGKSLAVSGTSTNATLLTTSTTYASSKTTRMWVMKYYDGEVTASYYTDSNNSAERPFSETLAGTDEQLTTSPLGENHFVFDGSKISPLEFTLSDVLATDSEVNSHMADDQLGVAAKGVGFFKYLGKPMMVAPYVDTDNKVAGVKVYDVTNGLAEAQLINTYGTDLAEAAPAVADGDAAPFMAAGAHVYSDKLDLILAVDNTFTKFSQLTDGAYATPRIFASALDVVRDGDNYTFTFIANSDAEEAHLIFCDAETGSEVGSMDIPNVKKGENTITVAVNDLPGENDEVMNWAVNLVGKPVNTIARINDYDEGDFSYSGILTSTIDNSTESVGFGNIYVSNRVNQPDQGVNGLYIYNADLVRVNDSPLRGGMNRFDCPYRLGVDAEGTVYIPDWSDPNSGLYLMDPTDIYGVFNQFFMGDRDADGLFTYNGVSTGSSATSAAITGTGKDTKLYVFLEDMSNNVGVYNIGNEDGTIAKTWDKAPDQIFRVGNLMLNTNCNIVPDVATDGIWVSQTRSNGNNQTSVPSFVYLDNTGYVVYNSGEGDMLYNLNGSLGSGLAINNEGDMLVVNDGNGELQFFGLDWADVDGDLTPQLTPKYSYLADSRRNDGTSHNNYIYQITFDYAGNMIATGNKLGVYSMPTDDNQTTVPARKALTVIKGEEEVVLESITLNATDADEVTLMPGETFQLAVVAYEPAEADATVTWSSSDEATATVDENGLVTAGEFFLPEGAPKRTPADDFGARPVTITATAVSNPEVTASVVIYVLPMSTGVNDMTTAKAISSVKYVSATGIESDKPFDGVNIVVTTYQDGTMSTTKVVK